jgi:lipoyl(octanoyl) transferase
MLDQPLNPGRPDADTAPIFGRADGSPAGWAVSRAPVAYPEAVAAMEARAEAIARGEAGELVWLLEHPPLYTAGVSAKAADRSCPTGSRCSRAGEGASTPITAPASGWPM